MCEVQPASQGRPVAESKDKSIDSLTRVRRYLPLRLDAHGIHAELSPEDIKKADFLRKRLLKLQELEDAQRRRKRFSKGENVQMDLVGPWQSGGDEVWLVPLLQLPAVDRRRKRRALGKRQD